MRLRKILEYLKETPENTNFAILKQMLDSFIERSQNELYNYTVDGDIADSVDLFGKKASDLQNNVHVQDGLVYGTLNYINDYSGFSSKPEEQHGYYVALHFELDGADSIKVAGSKLDSDGIIVLITKPGAKPVKVEITKGNDSIIDYIELNGLEFN